MLEAIINVDANVEASINGAKSPSGLDISDAVRVGGNSGLKVSSRKKLSRKSLFNHRGESSASLKRPKKRPRDDNDMFGLDKIIGIMSNSIECNSEEVMDGSEVFVTPDLNEQTDGGLGGGDEVVVQSIEMGIGLSQQQNNIDKEASATILLSKALGVENLENFVPAVKEVLISEGY